MDWELLKGKLHTIRETLDEESLTPEDASVLSERVVKAVRMLLLQKQYKHAISLLDLARALFPDDDQLAKLAALAWGGYGEYAMGLADLLQVPPPPEKLAYMNWLFLQGLEHDPSLPDLHWDLAVTNARFFHRFEESKRYLEKAKDLGYVHLMMPRLEDLIQRGLAGEQIDDGVVWQIGQGQARLRQLIWSLAIWPDIPVDSAEPSTEGGRFDERVFEGYCNAVRELVRDGRLEKAEFAAAHEVAMKVLQGDPLEYVADLFRITAMGFHDETLIDRLTSAHLRILVQMAHALLDKESDDKKRLMQSRRAASRALRIIQETSATIDADLHGEVLLALGQTFAHKSDFRLAEAMERYLSALDLKEAAGNKKDVKRLRGLLHKMIEYEIGQIHVLSVLAVGSGETTIDNLAVGFRAAKRLADSKLIVGAGMALAQGYRMVKNPTGMTVLSELLTLQELAEKERMKVEFEFASALAEFDDAAEALRIQEQLLADHDDLFEVIPASVFYLNLGNSRREVGNFEAARESFKRALRALPPPKENEIRLQEAQLLSLQGEVELKMGDRQRALRLLRRAERLTSPMSENFSMPFYSHLARTYLMAGAFRSTREHASRASDLLRQNLSRNLPLSAWDRMLSQWSMLDDYLVESRLRSRTKVNRERALVAAEQAKGRLLAWIRNYHTRETASEILEEERQKEALIRVRSWAAERFGRCVVSLFASGRGLAVFGVHQDGKAAGMWLDEFEYDAFSDRYFQPWESVVQRATNGDGEAWETAGPLTETLLDRIGEWLWRGIPELTKGGEDLVIVPHRLFVKGHVISPLLGSS